MGSLNKITEVTNTLKTRLEEADKVANDLRKIENQLGPGEKKADQVTRQLDHSFNSFCLDILPDRLLIGECVAIRDAHHGWQTLFLSSGNHAWEDHSLESALPHQQEFDPELANLFHYGAKIGSGILG